MLKYNRRRAKSPAEMREARLARLSPTSSPGQSPKPGAAEILATMNQQDSCEVRAQAAKRRRVDDEETGGL